MTSEVSIPDWLDEQFIEKALREGEKNDNIKLKHINVRPAVSAGDNICSVMFRVTTDYYTNNGSNGTMCTKSLIVKALPVTGSIKYILNENKAFRTETEILRQWVPAFRLLLNTSQTERCVFIAPMCYYHTDRPHEKLVIEDLCQSGFQMVQRTLPLGLDLSKLAISHLGIFYASSFAWNRQDPHSFDNFVMYSILMSGDAMLKIIQHQFEKVAENVPESHRKYSEKLRHLS